MPRTTGRSPRKTEAGRGEFETLVASTEGVQPWRRVFHAIGGVLIVAFVLSTGVESAAARTGLAVGLTTALVIDAFRLRFSGANAAFFRAFRALVSPREAVAIASSTWYLVGALGVLLVAPGFTFVPAILVLALADPAASVIGRLWGRHRLGKGTWEGAAVFFLVACATLVPFVGLAVAPVVAGIVAVLEVLPVRLDDNLTVPVAVALSLWALSPVG